MNKKKANKTMHESWETTIDEVLKAFEMNKDPNKATQVKANLEALDRLHSGMKQYNNARKVAFLEDQAQAKVKDYRNSFFDDDE